MSLPGRLSRSVRCAAPALLTVLAGACASTTTMQQPAGAGHHALLQVATLLQDRWEELRLAGSTDYRIASVDGELAIQALGRGAASALVRRVRVSSRDCGQLSWTWRVDRLQPHADIRSRGREDVAASIMLLFGDPGFLALPDPVPTLRYAWTSAGTSAGEVVDSPYLPGTVRTLVVRSGAADLGRWINEQRDINADFRRAFGVSPGQDIHLIALFTDNDQTGQPVTAYYRSIDLRCG